MPPQAVSSMRRQYYVYIYTIYKYIKHETILDIQNSAAYEHTYTEISSPPRYDSALDVWLRVSGR